MKNRIYFDHAATMPMLPEAQQAVAEAMASWANPSSPHGEGRAARAAFEDARQRIKAALDWPHELIFTSGASEAIAIGLACVRAERVLVSPTEHDAVLRAAGDAERLEIDEQGRIDGGKLNWALADDDRRAIVAVQMVNNETGVIQDLTDIGERVRVGGNLLFADCAQSAGKLPLPDADMISVSAHKFGGPPGIGALLVRDLTTLDALGGQEKGYRPGTENLPAAMGFAAALEVSRAWMDRAAQLRDHLDKAIEAEGGETVARDADRIATIAAYRMPGVASNTQLIQFDMAGIAVSAGSACSSGSLKQSHVLEAMGWDADRASEVVRISFGPKTKRDQIYRLIEIWKRIRDDARERAA